MTVTAYSIDVVNGQIDNATRWTASAYSASFDSAETVKAAPGSGYSLCIEDIWLQTKDVTEGSRIFAIGRAESGGVIGLIMFLALSAPTAGKHKVYRWKFIRPIQVGDNLPIILSSGGKGADHEATIVINGFTRKIA